MNLNKSTLYALYAAIELAEADDGDPVNTGGIARRYGVPEGVLAKVLQQLVRSGLAVGTRGVGGGYRLRRPAAEITVLDIMEALEPSRSPGECLLDRPTECPRSPACPLQRLLDEVDEVARATFASTSLATLAQSR